MMLYSRREDFQPKCFSGDYHACDSTPDRFVGCCEIDPCVVGGSCKGGALKPMSFNQDSFSSAFQDQQCSTGKWYTCQDTNPPFVGCCTSNPCGTESGCSDEDLIGGSLSSNVSEAASWLSAAKSESLATTSSVAKASSSSTVATASVTQAPSSSAVVTASSGQKLSGGAIAGVAIGVAALVIFLIAALFIYRRRKATTIESRSYETKNLMDTPSIGIYPAPSQGDAAANIHEAPGMNIAPKGFRNSGYSGNSPMEDPSENQIILTRFAGSSYPSPTSAYSPHGLQSPESPPKCYPVSELETPGSTFQNLQKGSPQSVELPSPNTPSLNHQHRSTAAVDNLGISQAFKHSPSPLTPSGHFEADSSEAHMRSEGRT